MRTEVLHHAEAVEEAEVMAEEDEEDDMCDALSVLNEAS